MEANQAEKACMARLLETDPKDLYRALLLVRDLLNALGPLRAVFDERDRLRAEVHNLRNELMLKQTTEELGVS
jgi:hypothetical protein